MDRSTYRHVTIVETEDGFIIRVFSAGYNLKADGIELPMSDVVTLIGSSLQHRGADPAISSTTPLCPTGYEDFFRSLGYELDALKVAGIRVIELSTGFLVGFTALTVEGELQRREALYDKKRIDQALARGYQRRGTGKFSV
jgi:hypothetical protein